ncbi:hypothetical protein SAMN05192533_1338 [Mesobacillus persicus]|uniref:Uncharacterized protein n=1 Tax=Mesobacillus persicus TaxID=930146 RepID=A0A1H8KVJ6_9BACI|nr:hypothetical protein [Mesobacillus persicus]SEN96879.1 hypothetical protein SAMN05192533_1338 [Mesobacillus persicus]
MAEIWIQEEKITEKFFDDLGHYTKVEGELNSIYFIGEGTEGDYVDSNKSYLLDFLMAQNQYPLYLTFIPYDDQVEEFITFLQENKMDYRFFHLEETRTYYTLFKKHQYHPPCFVVEVIDSLSLKLLVEETFWLPAQNEFYAISYSDNIAFRLESVKEWGRKKERSIPVFKVEGDTTFIMIFHDGAGFYLFSNEEKYSTVEELCSRLPKGTVITQINDTLVDKSE